MKLERPVRWGGLAALLAGVLLVVSEILRLYIDLVDPDFYRSVFVFDGVLALLLVVLVQLGLVGLYARQAGSAAQAGGVAEMLWEATPADQGQLLEPSTGQHLEVLGAHVYDRTWGHTEIHPMYKETFDDGSTYTRE